MPKQSTITFRTLGVNGVAQALHLLEQQGFVEQKSLRVMEHDHDAIVANLRELARRVNIYLSGGCCDGHNKENEKVMTEILRLFKDDSFVELKAADLPDEMNGGSDGKKKSDV